MPVAPAIDAEPVGPGSSDRKLEWMLAMLLRLNGLRQGAVAG